MSNVNDFFARRLGNTLTVEFTPDGAALALADDQFYLEDPADSTARVRIDVGGTPTATTNVVTLPGTGGLMSVHQRVRADAATALVGDTSEQPMFATAGDALTVLAASTYRFRCVAQLTTGATAVTVAFSLNGAATFTSSFALAFGIHAASGTAGTPVMQNSVAVETAFVVVASGTGVNKRFIVEGEFEVNAGGTIIPSVTFSADPNGTETVDVGSFFECWYLGGVGVTTSGAWA
jgi:hypothetical protein